MSATKLIAAAVATVALGGVGGSVSAAVVVEHLVAPGETLTSVAATDGLSIARLAAANGLSPDAELTAGATLRIPPRGGGRLTQPAGAPTASVTSAPTASVASAPTASVTTAPGTYRVVRGDTLSAIAARHGVSVDALAARNGLNPRGLLLAGARLSIPGSPATPASEPAAAPAPTPAAAPRPTAQRVSPSEVGRIAARHGVSPSLAEAIAAQESGFNNAEVSSTGATGVMQIEPETWRYIRGPLGARTLSPASARDNVRGGVVLLHALLAQTGGNPRLAAAGYYQGLQSVHQHGLYAGTRRYVRSVAALRSRFGGP